MKFTNNHFKFLINSQNSSLSISVIISRANPNLLRDTLSYVENCLSLNIKPVKINIVLLNRMVPVFRQFKCELTATKVSIVGVSIMRHITHR